MSTCLDCYGTNTIEPCADVGCLSTNFGKCVTYSGAGLFCSAGPINTFTYTGTAVAIVSDTTVVVGASGGTGSGATFSVTRGPASTSYSVAIVNKGGGYAVGDTLTIAGTAVGGASPANDITVSVTTLSALIDSTYTMDDAVKNLHDRICNLTPSGLLYSGFNFSCLRIGGNLESIGDSIDTAQEFAESASAALCAINTRLKGVETPTFTVPSCTVGLTSGTSTLSAILTEYGNVLCSISSGTGGISITGVTVPGSCSMTTQPASSASIGSWFNWVVTNLCSLTGNLSTSLTATNNTVSGISTFLGSTTRFNNSANCLTSLGGTSTDTAHATIGYLTTKVCAVDSTVAAIPSYIKTDSIGLNWVGCFGSAPYSFANTATSIQTQLQRIVTVLNTEKTTFSGDFTVTTNACGSRTVALSSSSSFSCSALASCSVSSLGDVSITAPSDPHVLYYNGANWVNKNINQLVTFSSTDNTIGITTTTTSGNLNVNLSVSAASATRAEFTPLSVGGANNSASAAFPGIPGSGYLLGVKDSNFVTLSGSIRLVSTSGFTLTSGTPVPLATAPVSLRPPHTVYFPVTVLRRTIAPFLEPSDVFTGMITLDTAGTLSFIPYPVFPAGSIAVTDGGANVELVFGGITYNVLP